MAWMNVDETEIYNMLRGNMALLIFESLVGIESAWRLRKFFPSIRELSQSLAVLSAWQTLALPKIGKIETQYQTASIPSELILSEDEIRRLTVRKIDEQLDKHRTLWRAGMTVIPRNYRLKNKAAKLGALRIAVAEHLRNMRQGSDMDGSDTLEADSRRQSAQMLDVMGFDELKSEKAAVRRGLGRLVLESYKIQPIFTKNLWDFGYFCYKMGWPTLQEVTSSRRASASIRHPLSIEDGVEN
ncbi:hypothetical protein B0H13DRAFT_1884650 [Mycena leptocephala]|nr:hypothetical protein B0H13DRAFT_1884650 [Mycena leptocephala]